MAVNSVEVHNPEIEVSALSTFVYDEESRRVIKLFFPQMFTGIRFYIFKELKTLITQNKPVSTVIIKDNLAKKKIPLLDVEMVMKQFNPTQMETVHSLMWIAQRMKELYFFRTSTDIARRMKALSNEGDIDGILKMGNAINKLHSKVFANTSSRNYVQELVDRVNTLDEYVTAPFPRLYEKIGGYTRKDLSSIGGKSSHNKTTFSLFQAVESIKMGLINKLLVISADEPAEMILRRIIASEANISTRDMRLKKVQLTYDDTKKILAPLLKHIVILDDVFAPDEIFRAINDHKADQVIVDHLQELRFPGEEGISESGITYSLKLFKEAARNTNGNVLCLSQVKDKAVDERFDDKVPRPHDFYYASTIRQKSREQCVVYWRYKDTQDETEKNIFEYYVWKSTYLESGKITFKYEPDYARFTELTLEEAKAVASIRAASAPVKQFRVPNQGDDYYEWK
jgi:replicative DNA helicase